MHYYKFDIDRWVHSTRGLLPEEEGIYLRLINHYYDTQQPIPEDYRRVIKRLNLLAYQEHVEEILRDYFVLTEKGFVHQFCEEILSDYKKNRKINRINGRKGGRPRHTAAGSDTETKPDRLKIETETKPKRKRNERQLINLLTYDRLTDINRSAWEEFEQHRKEINKPLSNLARTKALNIIVDLSPDEQQLTIDKTIQNRWTGLFPEKINEANKRTDRPESNHAKAMRLIQKRVDET